MKIQITYFEKFQRKVEKFNHLTLFGKGYLKQSLKTILFDYYYFVKYKNGTKKLNPLFFKTYKKVIKKKLKRFLKLESYIQYIILEVIEKVGIIDNDIQSLLIKSLEIKNHFIRFKILLVITSFKKKGYFLESLSYISSHHLLFNHQMLIDLFEKAIYMIPDLNMKDLLKNFDLYDEEIKRVIWISVVNNLSPNIMEKTYEIFENEKNSYVRTVFYQFPAFDIYQKYPSRFDIDFHSIVDSLREAVIEYAKTNYYKQIKNKLITELPKEKNIDIALSITKILQTHTDLQLVKLTEKSPKFLQDMINYYLTED